MASRLLRFLSYVIFGILTYECVTLHSDWQQQAIVGCLTLVIVIAMYNFTQAYVSTVMLIVVSLLTTARYAVWRVSQVYQAISDPSSDLSRSEIFFTLLLLSAEMYAFCILLLGFIQTIYPLRRPPIHLPQDIEEWPEVDLLIPTYNEPLSVVRSTALASINIDYPADKLHVYLLDDGRREEFRSFCEQIGVGYVTRTDNIHAKAGNINRALMGMTSPLVAIFDCDHVPTSSFLQVTAGWFIRDPKLAMLQTPHHFYSPDPFERNLHNYGIVPNEGELFYGLLQDGNDLWNATFFCGSCAVLRRSALDEIGGIAVETVTEDAHTSLRMQMKGWNTAYINIPQAAGLATESLSAHVGQRIRWARGMVQILRINNPLFAPGLKLAQRLCYFNAMVHFLYALPRLIFLTAPLVYMVLGLRNIPGMWITIGVYAVPHLVVSSVTNSRLQGRYRHSFWNEIYETVLAPYILGPTLLALINPKLGKFNVTAKGGIIEQRYFDTVISRPYRYLLMLNYVGLAIAPWRYFVLNADHRGAVLMNVFWILFNCVILGTANAVAVEEQQLRESIRLNLTMKLRVRTASGVAIEGTSSSLSIAGGAVTLDHSAPLKHGDEIQILFMRRRQEVVLPARVVACGGSALRFQYLPLTLQEEELLTLVLYSSPHTWLEREDCPVDRPLKSLATIMKLSLRGIRYSLHWNSQKSVGKPVAAAAAMLLGCVLFLPRTACAIPHTVNVPDHPFHRRITMSDMGEKGDVTLRGAETDANESLVLSESEVAQSGMLHLQYSFSPEMIPGRTMLTVSFNETTLVDLPMPESVSLNSTTLVTDIPIPGELLATRNTLRIHLQAHYKAECEDPGDPRLWARIGSATHFDISGILLPMAVDLSTLPAPFYEKEQSVTSTSIAVAFASSPSTALLQAAGAVSSWFGVEANSHKLTFPVTIGHLPVGNTVVVARNDSPLLDTFGGHLVGPHISIKVNPMDGISQILIVSGDDDGQVLAAARTLAAGATFTGASASIDAGALPLAGAVGEAPRWEQTTRRSSLWSYTDTGELQSNGSQPIASYVRLPPDLFWDDEQTVNMHLDYTYTGAASSRPGFMRVTANGQQFSYFPLATKAGKDGVQSIDIPLPVAYLRPFANTLLFEFLFQPARHDFCRPFPPSNSTGTLLKTSGLDLHSVARWASLPNLQLFADAGFPFTRAADLAQTTVVLPEQPNEREIGTMLDLLGYFGAQTGYPALGFEVGGIESYTQDRDLLVIGSKNDIVTTSRVDDNFGLSFQDGAFAPRAATTLGMIRRWWERLSHLKISSFSDLDDTEQARSLDQSLETEPSTVIESIESPTVANRSIVAVILGNGHDELFPAFADVSSSDQIHGDVSLQHGSTFDSYTLSASSYHIGEISTPARCRAWLHQEPWVGILLPFIMGLLYAPWLLASLEKRAQQRILGEEA
jgi:cellulose synthase (UDP-forming)